MVNNNNLMSPSSKRFDENVNQIQHPRLQSSIVDSAFTNAQKAKDHDKMILCELLESDQHRLRFLEWSDETRKSNSDPAFPLQIATTPARQCILLERRGSARRGPGRVTLPPETHPAR